MGSKIVLSGEYLRMKDTFNSLAIGLRLASLLIYFLMVGLDKSFMVPLTVMLIVPLCLIGILPMLYLTGTAVNVQSLLGFIFIVGIKVANTVLMTDYAQELRRHEGLTPYAGDPQGRWPARAADHDDRPGGLLRLDPRRWRWSGAARRTPRWPARSWAACWLASPPHSSFYRPCTRCSFAIRRKRKRAQGSPGCAFGGRPRRFRSDSGRRLGSQWKR